MPGALAHNQILTSRLENLFADIQLENLFIEVQLKNLFIEILSVSDEISYWSVISSWEDSPHGRAV